MLRAVLFDLDGTLHDRNRTVTRLIGSQYRRFPELHFVTQEHYLERFLAHDQQGYASRSGVYALVLQELGAFPELGPVLEADFYAEYDRHVCGYPDLHETLCDLRDYGFRLGLITNGSTQMQRTKIKALAIEKYFDTIVISEEAGMKKPQPQIFRLALGNLKVSPYDAVYVGDHPENDVVGARRAGMRAVWVQSDYWEPPRTADGIITRLSELPPLLKRPIYVSDE